MSAAYDAIVIGAGHNGLVTAAYLAKAGLRVLVTERRDRLGGCAVTEETDSGFKFESGAHLIRWLHPKIVRDLKLEAHGLELLACDPTVFTPLPDGRHLLLWRDAAQSAESIRALSDQDAEVWEAFTNLVSRAAGFLERLYDAPPPDVLSARSSDLYQTLRLAARVRLLGKRGMPELVRLLPMTVAELLDEWFESDGLKGTLGAAGITGIFQGPFASGTAYLFLHHHLGTKSRGPRPGARARGGIGALTRALAEAAREAGAELRTGAAVERILVTGNHATGIVLEGGDEIEGQRIISNADPGHTFLDLVDPLDLEPSFLRLVRNIKFRGACARVNLALDALPDFSCLPGDGPHLRGAISISPSLAYLERAYDDAKYGEPSREPYLEGLIPTLVDPSLAPPGKHILSVQVQYAPYDLKEGTWDDARRELLGQRVVETLAPYAPNIASAVLHRQVLSPLDLETTFGLTEGNIYHGEMTLDQLFFMRPVPGCSRYGTPIPNLYLCGAGAHPGGGVSGAPGHNAAQQILKHNL